MSEPSRGKKWHSLEEGELTEGALFIQSTRFLTKAVTKTVGWKQNKAFPSLSIPVEIFFEKDI